MSGEDKMTVENRSKNPRSCGKYNNLSSALMYIGTNTKTKKNSIIHKYLRTIKTNIFDRNISDVIRNRKIAVEYANEDVKIVSCKVNHE